MPEVTRKEFDETLEWLEKPRPLGTSLAKGALQECAATIRAAMEEREKEIGDAKWHKAQARALAEVVIDLTGNQEKAEQLLDSKLKEARDE